MKTSIAKIATVVALTVAMVGPASAMISQGQLNGDIHSALGADSNVFASVNQGVVTLSGYFGDAGDKSAAIQAALASEGVERVINNATVSN